jgi:hypothetical protein
MHFLGPAFPYESAEKAEQGDSLSISMSCGEESNLPSFLSSLTKKGAMGGGYLSVRALLCAGGACFKIFVVLRWMWMA